MYKSNLLIELIASFSNKLLLILKSSLLIALPISFKVLILYYLFAILSFAIFYRFLIGARLGDCAGQLRDLTF